MAAEANREVDHQVLPVEYPNNGRIGRYRVTFRGNGGFGRCVFFFFFQRPATAVFFQLSPTLLNVLKFAITPPPRPLPQSLQRRARGNRRYCRPQGPSMSRIACAPGCAAACAGHIPADVQSEIAVMDAVAHENVVRLVHERVIQGFEFPCISARTHNGKTVSVVPAYALVIEWCEYGTLLDLLMHAHVQNLLPAVQLEAMTLSYFRQIVNAVEALHAAGLYHLDIKAENVFLTCKPAPAAAVGAAVEPALPVEPRHLIKLADFGTVKRIDVRDGVGFIRCFL